MNTNKIINILTLIGVLAIVIGFSVTMYIDYKNKEELKENTKFPPWPSRCPDYWSVEAWDKDNKQCKNVHKLGLCYNGATNNIMDFSDEIFQGTKGMYYKCNWAKKCGIPWEGVDSLC